MSYKYYFGPSGYGKTYAMHRDILKISAEYPDTQIIVITPDQYTMQTQREIVLSHKNKSMMNIEVVSFTRLAGSVFEETGLARRILLDDTGKNLILRKLAYAMRDELKSLGSNIDKTGYIHEIKSVISEFMQYGISVDDVDVLIDKAGDRKALKGRLTDLKKLYAAFMDTLSNKYETREEKLSLLAGAIDKSELIKDSLVVFDGFTGFTPVQGQVILEIMKSAWQVWFAFTVDRHSITDRGSSNSLFALSLKSVNYIDKLAKDNNIAKLEDEFLDENTENRLKDNAELLFLERHLFKNDKSKYDLELKNITISVFDEPRLELENVASDIRKFILQGNKYQDVAIITGDIERYAPYAEEIFNEYDIPFFVDATRKLTLNPFTEYILSGLDVVVSNFSYDSVIHFLRSGLTGIAPEDIDLIDNYITARGIKGYSKWKKNFAYPALYMKERDGITGKYVITEKTKESLKVINEIRERIMSVLDSVLLLDVKKKYEAIYICKQLYSFIDDNNVYSRLKKYGSIFDRQNDFSKKNEYDQVYQKVMEVLESIAELLGKDTLDISEFIKIFQAGIGEIKIGVLPPGMDHVMLGDIERARLGNIKKLYFIGVNDGVIPGGNVKGGIISDLDRDYLERNVSDLQLAPTPRQKMTFQKLYLYMNMTKPSKQLYISYSKRDAKGASILPSYLIQEILRLFPQLEKKYVSDSDSFYNVYSVKNARTVLAGRLRDGMAAQNINQEDITKIFALIKLLKEKKSRTAEGNFSQGYSDDYGILKGAFEYYDKSEGQRISHELVTALYGTYIKYSISRLERYAACAYSHFLKYGMSISEKEKSGFENVDIGNIIHDILKDFYNDINKAGLKWENITEDEVRHFVKAELKTRIEDTDTFKADTAREIYQYTRMERILVRTIMNMGYHLEKGNFSPKAVEVTFENSIISPVDEGADAVKVYGKIDRIDTAEDDNKIYVKIVDYKTGNKSLDLVKLFEGKQLQLIVYLDQATEKEKKDSGGKKEVTPAAVAYYHVYDPMISLDEDIDETSLNNKIIKELRENGLIVNDDEIVRNTDKDIFNPDLKKKSSDVANLTIKSDGTVSGDVIDRDNLETVMKFARYKVVSMAEEMKSGNISPSKDETKTCEYCDYKDICHRDEAMTNADNGDVVDKDNVLNAMKAVLNADKKED